MQINPWCDLFLIFDNLKKYVILYLKVNVIVNMIVNEIVNVENVVIL